MASIFANIATDVAVDAVLLTHYKSCIFII